MTHGARAWPNRSFSALDVRAAAGEWPDDKKFAKAWLEKPLYETLKPMRCSMLLDAVDRAMRTSKQEAVTINGKLTVEHVLPQQWAPPAWPEPPVDASNDDETAIERRGRLLHPLGNLTLLTQELNSSVSNGPFAVKRPEIAKQSVLRLNTYFQDATTWDEAEIAKRGEKLLEHASASGLVRRRRRKDEMTASTHTYELQALTDIWTGDANTAQSKQANRLIPTGLLGSIRWWFEVLVRGLGGAPCDPSLNQKACLNEQHCVVCELFGCTGWARKFRFDVRDAQGQLITSKLTKGTTFHLRFTQLRAVKAGEWALLELTLRLIADFGALGGKTVLKPSSQNNKAQHADFGLVKLMSAPTATHTQQQLATYVSTWAKRPTVNGAAWASCSHMWFVDGKHLTRTSDSASSFNKVLGRPEAKSSSSGGDSWRAGSRGVSKKVYSFKSPARTFGFVQQTNEFDGLRDELRPLWNQPATNEWFVTGDALVGRLFPPGATP